MKSFFTFIFLVLGTTIIAQVVDKTRLEYDEDQLDAFQVGMAVTSDQKQAAFLLNNGELRIFNFYNSVFTHSYNLEVNEVLEIAFSQDDNTLFIVETNRLQALDWKTGDILLTEVFEEPVQAFRVAHFSNHFGVAFENEVKIWSMESLTQTQILRSKKEIAVISFSFIDPHIIVSPKWTLMGNQMYSFDYMTGKELEFYKGKFIGSYDPNGKVYYYQYNPIPGYTIGTPLLGHRTLPSGKDYQAIMAWDGKSEKSSDVGFYMTTLRIQNKIICAVGYRGFSVFDYNEGGRIFTTKKTKRERSSSAISSLGDYQANPHYQISEDKALINAYGDNINQIYSTSQNEIIGYIFVDAGGEYAIVSRDGRFDGTSASSEKLYWSTRKSNKKTSLSSTFERGFTPKLLRSLLYEDQVIEEIDIEEEIEKIPVIQVISFDGQQTKMHDGMIKVSTPKKQVQLQVAAAENKENLEQIKLFHNNKLVAVNEDPSSMVTFDVTLSNALGNENYLYVVGTTKNGIDTEKQKIIATYNGNTDAPPRLFLITVGINEYKNPRYNLNYAIADADAFSDAITDDQATLFSEVRHIGIRNADFTKPKMESILDKVATEAREQDLLIFYYAGHGVMSKGTDKPPEFFLVPHDVTQIYGRDELLFEKAVSASGLKEISRKINAQKQLFILDACQSAAALESIATRGILEEKAIAQLARSTGTFWITATGSEQFATEFETIGHGVFTYSLLEGLKGAADGANGDKKITVRELSAYLEERVPELAEKYQGTPQYPSSYSFGNDFPIMIISN
ncbi:MAG: caspase family protein [Cyclobacteriaceae bacterium]|nr:caspase family protein [Cyclobacteriaceae bacterium SS2]